MGVYYDKRRKKWCARSKQVEGRRLYLGRFDTKEEAQQAYITHRIETAQIVDTPIHYEETDVSFWGGLRVKIVKIMREYRKGKITRKEVERKLRELE